MGEVPAPASAVSRFALIFNPVSGVEDGTARRARFEGLIQEMNLECDLQETSPETGAGPLARAAVREGRGRVIVSGGDGSVTEAAGELAGTGVALGVVPGGTGNLLATNLGLPTEPREALTLALEGVARSVDVGRVNGEPFLVMAGMGADARMIHTADRDLKNRFGFLAYFIAAWQERRSSRVTYTLTIDGRRFRRRAHTVLVLNLGRITGGLEIVSGADATDGVLEVAILRARTAAEMLLLLGRTLLGRVGSDRFFEIRRGRHIRIETLAPQPVQFDGTEGDPTSRLEVTVQPGALQLVLPPGEVVPTTPARTAQGWMRRALLPAARALAGLAGVFLRRGGRRSAGGAP